MQPGPRSPSDPGPRGCSQARNWAAACSESACTMPRSSSAACAYASTTALRLTAVIQSSTSISRSCSRSRA
ncbi:hypothetical protein CP970_18315 [Streptomyces kanamyceticus]|uniref:Uncharacterized protein n=1 Tax=Streptomyces kanamyceticus TaxID=1967 RepID=A0A5J6GT61_STRKN|nr:hypothetical protein CP970_18315 [Streptomyces kanamyceticus]